MALIAQDSFVYIMTNAGNEVLYVGVTSDLANRCRQHINKEHEGSFTARYNINKLVFYERHESIVAAIAREKQIKGGSRKKKIELIEARNPHWNDLFELEVSKW